MVSHLPQTEASDPRTVSSLLWMTKTESSIVAIGPQIVANGSEEAALLSHGVAIGRRMRHFAGRLSRTTDRCSRSRF